MANGEEREANSTVILKETARLSERSSRRMEASAVLVAILRDASATFVALALRMTAVFVALLYSPFAIRHSLFAHFHFSRTSSSGADHGYGLIFISAGSATRGPTALGQM